MKRIIPVIFAASLALSGCSKSSSDEPIKQIEEVAVDKIKAKYISVLPELKDYAYAFEGLTKNKNYKVVIGRNDINYLVAYVDSSGKVYSKKTAHLDSSLKDKIGKIDSYPSEAFTEGNAIVLAFFEKNNTVPGQPTFLDKFISFEIVYPHDGKLINIGRSLVNNENKYVNNLSFTNKTVSFYSNGRLYMYDRASGKNTLETEHTSHILLGHALKSFFFENNKMILVNSSFGNLKISCHPLSSPEGNFVAFWESSIEGMGNLTKSEIEITDDVDNILIKLKGVDQVFKFKKQMVD